MEGDGVQLARLGVGPGFGGADLGGEPVQQGDELVHLGFGVRVHGEGIPCVPDGDAVLADVHRLALAVAGVGFQVQFLEEVQEYGLVR
jgi:hypothetical protein